MPKNMDQAQQLLATYSNEKLGAVVKAYLEDIVHNGFEGYAKHQVTGAKAFILDLCVAAENFDQEVG